MTTSTSSLLALLAGVAVSGAAFAQDASNTTVNTAEDSAYDPAICVPKIPANTTVISNWTIAENGEPQLVILRPTVQGDDNWNAMCLTDLTPPDLKADMVVDLVDVLNEQPEPNAPVIAALMDTYGDLVAQKVADTETAAGGGTGVSFGGGAGNPGENPGQLNTPQDPGDETSPQQPAPVQNNK